MHEVVRKIYIDKDELIPIKAIERDLKTRFIAFQFISNNIPINLTGCNVRVYANTSEAYNNEVFNDLEIIDAASGKARLELTEKLLTKGVTQYQLIIFKDEGHLSSNIFELEVSKSLLDTDALESSNEYKSLDVALKKADEYGQKLQEGTEKIELTYADKLNSLDSQLSDINKTKVIKAIDSTSLKANEKIDVEYLKFLQVQNYAEFYRKLRTGLPVNIASKGDSTVYGVDEYSDDKREPSTVTTDTGRTHVKTRASISYPEQLEINLRSIYGDKVSVENLGYSGSYAKFHYEQYFKKRDNDLTIIMLGINDSKLPECPYAGDVKEFIYWYEQLIIRELIWGKAVIIMLPTRVRRVNDDIIDVFSNSLVLLAEKYNIPYVDTQSFFTNYNADIYSDNLHFNAKGYKVLASRVTAFIINEGLKNRKKIKDGSNIGIFETTDSIKYIGAAIQQASSGYTPYALDPATRSVLRFQNNSKAIYSFYAEDENLVIYPTVRLEANSSIKLTLDFGVQQAEVENITNIYGTTSTDNKFRNSYTLTSNSNSVLKFKDIYEKEAVKPLVITNKGWHTLLIETNGDVKLWGIEFKKFRNTKYKSLYRGEFYNVGDVITLNDKISSYDNLYIYANSLGFEGHLIDFNVSSVQDIRGINLSNDTDGTSVVFFELGFIKDNDIQIRITRNKQVSLVNGVQSLYNNPDENRIVEIFGVRYRD